ncbi:hypothetical protein KI387_024639, partial [Taxus chinensis]
GPTTVWGRSDSTQEPISYRREEIDKDLTCPNMIDLMEEAQIPWDEDDDVGVGA